MDVLDAFIFYKFYVRIDVGVVYIKRWSKEKKKQNVTWTYHTQPLPQPFAIGSYDTHVFFFVAKEVKLDFIVLRNDSCNDDDDVMGVFWSSRRSAQGKKGDDDCMISYHFGDLSSLFLVYLWFTLSGFREWKNKRNCLIITLFLFSTTWVSHFSLKADAGIICSTHFDWQEICHTCAATLPTVLLYVFGHSVFYEVKIKKYFFYKNTILCFIRRQRK